MCWHHTLKPVNGLAAISVLIDKIYKILLPHALNYCKWQIDNLRASQGWLF